MIAIPPLAVKVAHPIMQNLTGGGMVLSDDIVTGGAMPDQDGMAIDERGKLRIMRPRYGKADRPGWVDPAKGVFACSQPAFEVVWRHWRSDERIPVL